MTIIFGLLPARSSGAAVYLPHVYNLPPLGTILRNRENSFMFHCDTCNITTNNKFDYKRHVFSPKHQRLCSENAKCKTLIHSLLAGGSVGDAVKNIPPKPTSEICVSSTPQKTPIDEIVHIDLGEEDANQNVIYHPSGIGHVTGHVTSSSSEVGDGESDESHVTGHVTETSASGVYSCKFCKRPYINRTGLWRHNKKYGTTCIVKAMETSKIQNTDELKNMIHTMMQLNQEFKSQILELYKTTAANAAANAATMMVASPLTYNNTNNMTNCYNQTYNLQIFLKERCKDAMNMKDFVDSIQLNTDDLESVGKLGYVEGISNILISNLNKTELHKRPVHCSDIKRETLYVKDADKWEQDSPDYRKMTNAVLAVEHKNVQLMGEWAAQHPRCMDSNSNENVQYFKLSKTITDGEKDGNISKVIKKVAKNVFIDKTIAMSGNTA